MEAVVTLKVSPAELDVLRAALQDRIDSQTLIQSPACDASLKQKRDARHEIVKATDILEKLR